MDYTIFLLQLGNNCHEVLNVSDVGFILDVSGSIIDDYWEQEKMFVQNLTRKFEILPHGARVSIVTFNAKTKLDIKFSDHKTNKEFETALSTIKNTNGGTDIGIGLKKALDEMFQTSNGRRPASPQVALLITDGQNSGASFVYLRNEFQARIIKILVVGVGSDVQEDELRRLVDSQDDDFLFVDEFSKLDINDFIKKTKICKYLLRS